MARMVILLNLKKRMVKYESLARTVVAMKE